MSLAYTFTDGVDAVEVGSYSNVTGSVVWTEVPAAAAAAGIRVCGRSCTDHCTQHGSCGACGGDLQCGWCPASSACLSRAAAVGLYSLPIALESACFQPLNLSSDFRLSEFAFNSTQLVSLRHGVVYEHRGQRGGVLGLVRGGVHVRHMRAARVVRLVPDHPGGAVHVQSS